MLLQNLRAPSVCKIEFRQATRSELHKSKRVYARRTRLLSSRKWEVIKFLLVIATITSFSYLRTKHIQSIPSGRLIHTIVSEGFNDRPALNCVKMLLLSFIL